MSTQASGSGSDYQSRGEKISDPAQIARLLKNIMENRGLLAITIPGVKHIYNSAILEVPPERNYLLLDELNPTDGHAQLLGATDFHSFTRHRGVEIHFASRLLTVGQEPKGTFYRVAFPETLDYKQRRESYRVRIGIAQNISVTLENEEALPFKGRVFDLSAGGFGAFISQDAKLRAGQELPKCTIQLPGNKQIVSPVEIRYARPEEQTGELRIGARFLRLGRAERNTIEKFIVALERELIRKMPKD